jgi:hypothetical protein
MINKVRTFTPDLGSVAPATCVIGVGVEFVPPVPEFNVGVGDALSVGVVVGVAVAVGVGVDVGVAVAVAVGDGSCCVRSAWTRAGPPVSGWSGASSSLPAESEIRTK